MRFKPKALDVPEDDPFLNDKLDRKKGVLNLTEIIKKIDEPFVITINSPWGTGKTTFITMWQQYLCNNGVNFISFNAWENDYVPDPLACLIGELSLKVESLGGKKKEVKQMLKRLKSVGLKVAKIGIPTLIKAGTMGVLDLKKETEEVISGIAGEVGGDIFEEYLNIKKNLVDFRTELNTLVSKINAGKSHPFIIFIDELDRCRPNFAIEILETCKHLFEIENVIFVLALDEAQLSNAIKVVYGTDTETQGYLRRFIDLSYALKSPEVKTYCADLYHRFDMVAYFEERGKYRDFDYDGQAFIDLLVEFVDLFKLSLRDIEKIFIQLRIVLFSTPSNHFLFSQVLCFMLILKLKDEKFLNKIIDKSVGMPELVNYFINVLGDINFIKNYDDHLNLIFQSKVGLAIEAHRNRNEDEMYKYFDTLAEENKSDENIQSFVKRLKDFGQKLYFHTNIHNVIDLTYKRISIAEEFKYYQEPSQEVAV